MTPNNNNVTDRRAGSEKRSSDILPSQYPVVTKAAYQEMFRGTAPAGIDLKVHQLVAARIRLQQFFSAVDGAILSYNPRVHPQTPEMYQLLRSIRVQVEREFLRFPITIN